MTVWPGECHVHAGIRPDDVARMMEQRPGVDLLDPSRSAGAPASACTPPRTTSELARTTHVLSTEGMVQHRDGVARTSEFVVATETGILHRLHKEAPDKRFYAMSERAVCRYMKMITLEKVRDSLRDMQHHVRCRRRSPTRRAGRDPAHGGDR